MERENGFHAADVYTVCCCCAVTTIVDQWVLVLCLTRSPELKTSESESCVPVSTHSYIIDISTKYDPLHTHTCICAYVPIHYCLQHIISYKIE